MITSASHATGVNVRFAFCALPSAGRALPARSALPLLTASRPEAVLNGCITTWPWPLLSHAWATSSTTPSAVASSPRQIRLPALPADALALPWGWLRANAVVVRQAPIRATDSRRVIRTDMMVESPGIFGNEVMGRVCGLAGTPAVNSTRSLGGRNQASEAKRF